MKRKNTGRSNFFNTRNMCFMGLLVALILLMSFTPLGYLHIGIIEITFLMVPVAVGSIVLGPAVGAFLGLVFGITSFAKCFIDSPFGAMLFSIQPVYCFMLCIIPRILAGLLPAYIFKLISKIEKNKQKLFSYAVAALSCALLNTVFFVGGLMLLYGHTDYIQSFGNGFWSIVWAIVGINGIIEAPTCCIIGGAIAKAVYAFAYNRKETVKSGKLKTIWKYMIVLVLAVIISVVAIIAAYKTYLSQKSKKFDIDRYSLPNPHGICVQFYVKQ